MNSRSLSCFEVYRFEINLKKGGLPAGALGAAPLAPAASSRSMLLQRLTPHMLRALTAQQK
jgi:hypothetical protein